MNVVFLLVTTAISAGADPAPIQPANPPAVMAPAPASDCGCGGGCASAWHEKPSFFDRFRRSKKSDCCDSCSPAPAPCCAPAPAPTCKHEACESCGDSCCGKSSIFSRFGGLFSRKSHGCCDSGCESCGCGGGDVITAPAAVTPTQQPEQLKKMPKGENDKKKIEAPLPNPKPLTNIETEGRNPFELDRRYQQRAGRAADCSKVTGQLYFAHADGGVWVLRYASLSTEDSYGGSVILARDRSMNGFREGDLVTVEGQVLQAKWSRHLGGALYQIRTISLVDRPQP